MPCRPLLCNQSFINPTIENQVGPVQLIPYTTTKLAWFDLVRVDLVLTLVGTHPLNAIESAFRWRDPAGLC
jgi:hypothetical protein